MEIKENKGITLISLVITIIVLIIIASVGIYLSLGNNGIFIRTKQAKELTNKQTATEKINLKITTAQINKYVEKQVMPTLKELSEILKDDSEIQYVTEKSQIASTKYEVGENPSSIFTKLNEYPYEFEINGQLQLASIDGTSVSNENLPSLDSKYSTSEQVIGTWINGKPLYRKVVVFENLTYNDDIFHGPLDIQDMDAICRAEVYHSYNNNKSIETARSDSASYYFSWYISGGSVNIVNKISNIKNFDYIVIVEYTKN